MRAMGFKSPRKREIMLRTGDEDVGAAVLAVVDEEIGFGAVGRRVFARVRVRRPLRHPRSPSLEVFPSYETALMSRARKRLSNDGRRIDGQNGMQR